MADESNKLTVADLEAAKEWHAGEAAQFRYHEKSHKMHGIAATCIKLVEEMVKLDKNIHDGLCRWEVEDGWSDSGGDIPFDLAQINTEKFGCISNVKDGLMRETDADHIVALHNLWLRAVAAFGG